MTTQELIEQLANKEHERWSHWQAYLFSKCEKQTDGSMLIPSDLVTHWQNEIDTPYSDLPERYKQSDRDQVMQVLPIIEAYAQQIDPTVLTVVKEMAKGELADDCVGGAHCLYCAGSHWSSKEQDIQMEVQSITHEPDCPVLVSRRLLIQWKMPLNIYHISGQYLIDRSCDTWIEHENHETATNPDEIKSEMEAPDQYGIVRYRNVTITFVRVFPVEKVE